MSQDFKKAVNSAIPLLLPNKFLVKMVMLVAIPGDNAHKGLAVNYKRPRERGMDSYAIIPKHIVATSAGLNVNEKDRDNFMQNLHRKSKKIEKWKRRCAWTSTAR
mgnify:CR=1 FL=1